MTTGEMASLSILSLPVLALLTQQVSGLDLDVGLNNEVLLDDQMPLVMVGDNRVSDGEVFTERYRRSFYR